MTARRLTPHDAAAVLAVIHQAFGAQEVQTIPPSGALRETADSIRTLLEQGGGHAIEAPGSLAIQAPGGLAATSLWREAEGGLYLGRLAVLPAHRNRGLARALVLAAEAEARRRNLPRIHVGVRLALPGNRRLFESLGFTEFRRPFNATYNAVVSANLEKHL